ncbi:MAG TPA: nuclear transport factor 2 family protein [Acidimicrobiia bacterium]|nr:nuclear transport factor 2 family protein [Acidimicrobiia bacterium]
MELWELVARESIRDRIARWNSNGDAGRMAEMVKVLAPDVQFSIREGEVLHGRDEVLQSLLGVREAKARSGSAAPDAVPVTGRYLPPGKRPSIRHYTSSPTIDFESETHARVRTYYAVLSSFGLDHWGRYLDEFGVVDGEWLITERTVTTEGVDPDGWAAVLA